MLAKFIGKWDVRGVCMYDGVLVMFGAGTFSNVVSRDVTLLGSASLEFADVCD